MQIKQWILDGHPQRYHVAALLFAIIALSVAFTATILAEDTVSTTAPASTTTNPEPVSCSYSYSDWNTCQPDNKRYRTVTGVSPSDCVRTSEPKTTESCNYTAPTTTPTTCSYNYNSWGTCQSNGTRSRSVSSVSPSGCTTTTAPILTESCTYSPNTTGTTTPTTCSYNYNSWGTCQSNGTRSRSVSSVSPSGCTTTTAPILTESCTYSPNTTGTTTPTTCSYNYNSWGTCQSNGTRSRSVSSVSPSGCTTTTAPILTESCTYSGSTATGTTTPIADQCLYTYSNWGVCQSDGKRKRVLFSKLPSGCAEYTKPVLEQSCIYDTTATTTPSTTTAAPTTTTPASTSEGVATNTTSGNGGNVTPTFAFVNVNDGITIRGTFEIKGQVQGAQGVEFYLVPNGSNTYKYIGSGTKISDSGWNLKFRSEGFPNGEFYLRAKIKNMYGEYGGGQRKVRIVNDASVVATTAPGEVFTPLALNDEKKAVMLQTVAEELQIPKDDVDGSPPKTSDEQKKHIFNYCESNPEKCFPERDSDNDGLSDIDEIRYGTDPKGADSDLDGFIDGDEVKNGFDPVKYSAGDQSDRIVFESPKVAGETKEKIYAVENIELKETVKTETEEPKKKMTLTGKGLPNSFVTIYIYSDPIVLTVKTDSDGNWTYELDKELEDGEHEAYVAITDNTGKITGKSNPFPFVKTAQAVTVIPTATARSEEILPVTQNRAERDILILVSIVVAALAIALAIIGLVKHRHNALKEEIPR